MEADDFIFILVAKLPFDLGFIAALEFDFVFESCISSKIWSEIMLT